MGTQNSKTIVSIDLCEDYSQVCYYTEKMSEPESISTVPNEQKFLIPTVIGKIRDLNEWVIGDLALFRASKNEVEIKENLLKAVLQEEVITLGNENYSAKELINSFLEQLLLLVKAVVQRNKYDKIVVTIPYPQRLLMNIIYDFFEKKSYDRENIKVIGHAESFIYYTIFQKKELWVNDVLVFDYTKHHFLARHLKMVRARTPQPLIVEEEDFSKDIYFGLLKTEKGKKECDNRFIEIINQICSKSVVSTIFLTGCGFYEKWMEKSVNVICLKRRVFQGYNLFVKGAAYTGIDLIEKSKSNNYQFVCPGRTLINIGLEASCSEEQLFVPLSNAGISWYEAGARMEGILDGVQKIKIHLESSLSKRESEITIDLSEFPNRPNKTTRVEITLIYKNDRQCVIIVKDLGFGDFFKTSNQVVKKTLNIEEYL